MVITPLSSYSTQNIKKTKKTVTFLAFLKPYLLFYEVSDFVDVFLHLQIHFSKITERMKIKQS
jgi:hypothetical protein